MINTLENPVFCKLVDKYDIGINVEPENVSVLKKSIEGFLKRPSDQGDNARKLAETEFDRKVSYRRIVDIVAHNINE